MITNEKDLQGQKITLNKDEQVMYIKVIGIGPKTLEANECVVSGIPAKVDGFFITGDKNVLRGALHKILDMACDAQEKANGQSN
jgi:hypothetical protein